MRRDSGYARRISLLQYIHIYGLITGGGIATARTRHQTGKESTPYNRDGGVMAKQHGKRIGNVWVTEPRGEQRGEGKEQNRMNRDGLGVFTNWSVNRNTGFQTAMRTKAANLRRQKAETCDSSFQQ